LFDNLKSDLAGVNFASTSAKASVDKSLV